MTPRLPTLGAAFGVGGVVTALVIFLIVVFTPSDNYRPLTFTKPLDIEIPVEREAITYGDPLVIIRDPERVSCRSEDTNVSIEIKAIGTAVGQIKEVIILPPLLIPTKKGCDEPQPDPTRTIGLPSTVTPGTWRLYFTLRALADDGRSQVIPLQTAQFMVVE